MGRAVLGEPPPYGATTTLKNRIAAFFAAVAPSTVFHSPPSVAACHYDTLSTMSSSSSDGVPEEVISK